MPLVKSLNDNIQNLKNLITQDAAAGWIRGSIPRRAYMRDINAYAHVVMHSQRLAEGKAISTLRLCLSLHKVTVNGDDINSKYKV